MSPLLLSPVYSVEVFALPNLLIVSSDGPTYKEIFAREAPELEVHLHKRDDPIPTAFVQEMDFLFAWYFPPELVKNAPKLRWISSTGAGVDNVMAAREWLPAGVPVTRMVHVFDDVMAEYTLGYLLAVQLDIPKSAHLKQQKQWGRWNP